MFSESNLISFAAGVGVAVAGQFILKIKRNPFNVLQASQSLRINNRIKMVLVVRPDLKMGTGKTAAQCAHAAVSCYSNCITKYPEIALKWKVLGQPKIVLKANENGEDYLLGLEKKASEIGLTACVIRDAGRTQVHPGSITVLGIGPGVTELVDAVTHDLKLL